MKKSFKEESPTRPAQDDVRALSAWPEAQGVRAGEEVQALVPLDIVPVLAVARAEVPWSDLGELAQQLLRRVDGATSTMTIVTGTTATPSEGARELAALTRRGLLRLLLPASEQEPVLQLDLDGLPTA